MYFFFLFRSEKVGVLTNELTAAEKRVDLIKESCLASGKKLSACMQRLTQESTDRRNSVILRMRISVINSNSK